MLQLRATTRFFTNCDFAVTFSIYLLVASQSLFRHNLTTNIYVLYTSKSFEVMYFQLSLITLTFFYHDHQHNFMRFVIEVSLRARATSAASL
jgi:hypothetical protein